MAAADGPDLRPARRGRFGPGISSRTLSDPAIDLAELGDVDAVLLTQDHHGDNLDEAGRAVLRSARQVPTTVSGARRLRGVLGGRVSGLRVWSTAALEAPGRPAVEVTAAPCRHGPPLRAVRSSATSSASRCACPTGTVAPCGSPGHRAPRRCPGGGRPGRGRHRGPAPGGSSSPSPVRWRYSMTARDAVGLCRLLRPRAVIPVHYEGWAHFRQNRGRGRAGVRAGPARATGAHPPARGGRAERTGARRRSG